MTQESALAPGKLVGAGRFTLVRQLGRGGMGVVWQARDERLGEDVALKFLPVEIRVDQLGLEDLRRETLRSRRLSHPQIVRIYDLHEEEGEAPFISMELVEGRDLVGLRIEQEQPVFSWARLQPWVGQLCEALDYAHGQKVIHRDLKPSNLMLDQGTQLKLADFGIAAVMSDSLSRVTGHRTSGTLAYMSPQHFEGRAPQVADDIYSLGATLYELLTGRPPFYTGDVGYQILQAPATPLEERLAELGVENEIPPAVGALVLACLAKDPAQRPQSARDVAEWVGIPSTPADLVKPLSASSKARATSGSAGHPGSSDEERADSGSWKRLWQYGGVLTAAAVVGIVAWLGWGRSGASPLTAPTADTRQPAAVLLVVDDQTSTAHDWYTLIPTISHLLVDSGQFTVQVSRNMEVLSSASDLESYQLILWARWQNAQLLKAQAKQNLLSFVRSGRGFVVLHAGSAAFQNWPAFGQLCGRRFEDGKSGHDKYRRLTVEIAETEHPITRGLSEFQTTDELYVRLQGGFPIEVLARAYAQTTGQKEPVVFTTRFGSGRVFHCILGHDAAAIRNPPVAKMLVRGCAWVCTREVP